MITRTTATGGWKQRGCPNAGSHRSNRTQRRGRFGPAGLPWSGGGGGGGSFTVEAALGGAEPYPSTGTLLVFNGHYKGKPALLGQIYTPPIPSPAPS